jgi:hypothetical protein
LAPAPGRRAAGRLAAGEPVGGAPNRGAGDQGSRAGGGRHHGAAGACPGEGRGRSPTRPMRGCATAPWKSWSTWRSATR